MRSVTIASSWQGKAIGLLLAISVLGTWFPGSARAATAPATVTLTLVAYSTPAEAYAQIIPAFQKTPAGQGVQFHTSYGASGQQSRAVAAGLNADIVAFSLAPDIARLVSDKPWPPTGMPVHSKAWSLTRSSCLPCARGIPSTSQAGTT